MNSDAGFSADHPPKAPVWCETDEWDPADLPIRPWISPGYFMRGHVTTIIGPGGVSKSSLVLAIVVAHALGREFHEMRPRGVFRSMVFNAEDDADEQRRRLTAVLTSFGKSPADIKGMIARTGPEAIGTLFERDPDTGDIEPTEAMKALKELLRSGQADILFVDPLAELHNVDENDNNSVRAIVAEFRSLARECNIAVVIIHHTRKGVVIPGDVDAARGASALIGASRVVLTLTGMSKDEAKAFGLPETSCKHHFRMDGGKANYHSLTDCQWFERVVYQLPNGDDVAVTVPWQPPEDVVTPEARAEVEAAIERGSPFGPWSPKIENRSRSIKHAMADAGITTAPGQKDLWAALQHAGFAVVKFRDENRKWVQGVRSPSGKPSNVEWFEDDDQ